MKVTIVEDPNIKETEISIVCEKMTNEINDIVSKISAVGLTVAGKKDEETFLIPMNRLTVRYFSVQKMKSMKQWLNFIRLKKA